jgi:hypothetical protein
MLPSPLHELVDYTALPGATSCPARIERTNEITDNDNAKLGPYMCKMVSITGEVAGDTKNVRRTIMATSLKAASK